MASKIEHSQPTTWDMPPKVAEVEDKKQQPSHTQAMEGEEVSSHPQVSNPLQIAENNNDHERLEMPENHDEYSSTVPEQSEEDAVQPVIQQVLSPLPPLELSDEIASIEQVYASFQRSHVIDPSLLSQATDTLIKLKQVAARMWKECPEEEAFAFQEKVDSCTTCLQEMNMQASSVTKQDFVGAQSFFSPPPEIFYIDEDSGEKYYMPDHSELAQYTAQQLFSGKNYQGFGVLRRIKLVNPKTREEQNADIFFVSKSEEQIAYETQNSYSWLSRNWLQRVRQGILIALTKERIEESIRAQKASISAANDYFQQNIASWNYDFFIICGTEELIELGYPKEKAILSHAVVFFHKKYP